MNMEHAHQYHLYILSFFLLGWYDHAVAQKNKLLAKENCNGRSWFRSQVSYVGLSMYFALQARTSEINPLWQLRSMKSYQQSRDPSSVSSSLFEED